MDTAETVSQRRAGRKKKLRIKTERIMGKWCDDLTYNTVIWNSRRKGERVWGRSNI